VASARQHDDSPETLYRARADAYGADAIKLSRRFNGTANIRLVAFAATAICLIWGLVQAMPIVVGLGVAFGVVFAGLVRYHRQLGRQRNRANSLRDVNLASIERLARHWDTIPLRHHFTAAAAHPYAADLDLFGRASLLHLLDTTRTSMGQATLTRWLLNAANPVTVRARQAAVVELASKLDLRQELEVSVEPDPDETLRSDPESLLAWAESGPPTQPRPALLWMARISPVLLCAFGLANVTGIVNWPVWLLILFINVVLWQVYGQQAYATLSRVASHESALRQYVAGFDLLSAASVDAARLAELHGALHVNGRSAAAYTRSLERIGRCVIPRSALVYWVVQLICLWDVHVLAALDDWRAKVGPSLRAWLESLGEFEALAALAGLVHAHPDWALPAIDTTACRLEAQQAGHPLLAPGTRVDNAVTLGPVGTFVLVTGSNMAGKSTYLRTIGTNIVLAQAGGPVCAHAFVMPPLALCTSMRIVDSLEAGVSTFLAEVMRLKQVIEVARRVDADHTMCYLLDEVLQGTNSAERQIAVRQVIRYLLRQRAIGAVSTHDLALADVTEFDERATLVHFEETLTAGPHGPTMTFGYRVQPGVATSTNALRLVAMLGLDDGAPES
jgi:hypothetical protein